ncbi:MAG: hypothetical protein A2074_00890 [Candidatus Aquicultor primus]|uniref:Uncharacterized protein n=1 Tax=Candidatus Aquicultor primus TaxID=1797195 RepID=A0A1F2USX6_9ACTN|nr:MAG: hypothetical protein A2074_00890 [Candidatus Aquicultor primus]
MRRIKTISLGILVVALIGVASIGGYNLQHPKKAISSPPAAGPENLNPAEVVANSKLPENIKKATGGPFKSKEEILAKAKDAKAFGPGSKLSGRAEAVLMKQGETNQRFTKLTGEVAERLDVDDSKEVWVAIVGGEFESTWRSNPSGLDIPPTKWIMYVYDATTAEVLSVKTGPGSWPDKFLEPLQ